MAWFWRSEKWPLSWLTPFVWWLPSYLLMVALVYGWNSPVEQQTAAVPAKATFEESADCVRYWHDQTGWRLNNHNVAECFPTQTAAKKKALIACFNTYEQDHPDHDGWPENNMRGCEWDGLVAVPVQNVASLAFGKVVTVPAAPRAGKRFALRVAVTRSDSAAKVVRTALIDTWPIVDVAVTINGENLALKSVGAPCESCPVGCSCSSVTTPEYWFFDSKIRLKFTVPMTAEGKRLTIKMTAAEGDTPTATKVVTYTVSP
jgi:hypothetical protein